MEIKRENINDTSVKLTITVGLEEVEPFLEKAAKKISLKHKIKGFRAGKASYEVIKQQFGEMAIYQEAVNTIIDHTLLDALKQENLDIVGQPKIDVNKMAPDNPFEYSTTVELIPSVEMAKDWRDKVSIKVESGKVPQAKIDELIENLSDRHSKQVLKTEKSVKGDKLILDFELSFDNVIPDDGIAKGFEAIIGSNKMIPGFEEELIGLKEGDEKIFKIPFPKDYYHKQFSGKKGQFKVNIKHVFSIEKPKKDDDLAKSFNYETYKDFVIDVEKQLQIEKDQEAMGKAEVEMFDALIVKTKFGPMPESMLHAEKDKMIGELKQNLMQQGLKYEDYLSHMKKSEEELKGGFTEDATKRVQSALIMRSLRQSEKIELSDDELDAEFEKSRNSFKDNPEMLKQVESPQYKVHMMNQMVTQRIINMLKDAIITKS